MDSHTDTPAAPVDSARLVDTPAVPADAQATPVDLAGPVETPAVPADAQATPGDLGGPADTPAAPADAQATPADAEAAPARPTGTPARPPRQSARARHRGEFYAKLTELRAEAPDDRGRSARITAAVERVGGAEVVREALAPKQRTDGTPMKWSAVCCDQAFGTEAADPAYSGWVRLAGTPVREIKAAVGGGEQRGRRTPGRGNGNRRGSEWPADGTSRQDIAQYGTDGSLRSRLQIPALP